MRISQKVNGVIMRYLRHFLCEDEDPVKFSYLYYCTLSFVSKIFEE